MDDPWTLLELEMERLRQRHVTLLGEVAHAQEIHVRWTLSGGVLRWHVALEQVLEPDVDVEIAEQVLIVRARPLGESHVLFLGVLPIPRAFDGTHPRIHFEAGYLEIQVFRGQRETP